MPVKYGWEEVLQAGKGLQLFQGLIALYVYILLCFRFSVSRVCERCEVTS